MTAQELSTYIKAEAKRLGFAVCGIAKADDVPHKEAAKQAAWVAQGHHGTMSYLERNCDKRQSPQTLFEGCKSIICVAMSYAQDKFDDSKLHIARYAQGADYHKVIKERLHLLLAGIKERADVKGRPFCDTAPVMERYWAVQAGLGWIGRNHQLIIPKMGSYFFLGELFVDCELQYDEPFTKNHCGNCHNCIDNCPTGALTENSFDARNCLSYLTIEHRGELPKNIGKKMGKCFYGCDRCQNMCPWNKLHAGGTIEALRPNERLSAMSDDDWHNLTQEQYDSLFKESAVERAGYAQLMRNIAALEEQD